MKKSRNPENIKKNKIGNRKAGSRNIKLAPPPFVAQSTRKMVVRTTANAGTPNLSVNMQQLAQLCGCFAISATASNLITPLIRILKICMWGPVATAGTTVTTSLTWVNMAEDFESPPKTLSDTSVSFDRPAHLSSKPPRGSLSEKWHGSTLTDQVLLLGFPTACVVDFHLEFMLMDNVSTFAAINGPTLVGALTGQIYHHPIQATLIPVTVNSL